jgi:hypothetical protein
VFLDAAETLDEFMLDGIPDPALVEATVGPIFDAATRDGRPIRVFGEMVALLWAEGNVTGALALETLSNDLAAKRRFFLMCAYPLTSLDESPLRDVNALRELHSQSWLLGLSTQYAEKSMSRLREDRRVQTAVSAATAQLLIPVPMSATVAVACQFAIRTLNGWEVPRFIDAAAAKTSELAANAVVHARTAYRLTLSRSSSSLRIAVEDSLPCHLDARSGHRPDGTTHGLATVHASSSRCGYSLAMDGKTVWAELGMSARCRR